MSSSSDSDSEREIEVNRLGDCEVCGKNQAKYTCPKCEVKTCCLECVRIHKKELECDGIRDRTKFIRIKDFTDTDLLSDYRLLEECARFVYGVKIDEKKKYTRVDKELPIYLFKLKMAARQRGTALQFLAQNFSRHKVNTTRYNKKMNIINWRVEWVFPNVESEPLKFVDERCGEHKRLSELLDKYLNPDALPFEGSKALSYYKSVGFSGVKILLRAEKVKGSGRKFFELDPTESLAENLSGKCIVEFPIIFVVLKDHAYNFEIITPEDEIEEKSGTNTDKVGTSNSKENTTSVVNGNPDTQANTDGNTNGTTEHSRKRPRQLLTEKVAQEKKMEIEKEIKAARKKKPKNLLFTTGYSSEESLDDNSEDEVET
ncbi:box C/D snoRNA protein 1 [Spodoptera frugiperda]|uniref:Box C/D snoRNA protein 1 n=1 Tax=Spodoptera frugiperda TaxID=7108 RepID=A0A9R0EFE5_SPOFR|nr:box C/D snoRNA protein 1 [Spodoptera frugiperda]